MDAMPNVRRELGDRMTVCTDYCKPCYYASCNRTGYDHGTMTCDYLIVTGEKRGCPAGDGCKRFREGKRSRRPVIGVRN